jgi:hypothetical protein
VQKDVDANGLYEWLYSDGIDYVVQKKDDSVSLLPVEKYLEVFSYLLFVLVGCLSSFFASE